MRAASEARPSITEDHDMATLRAVRQTALTTSVGALLFALLSGSGALAAPLAISDVPVFLNATTAEPLVMLALSNDEQLYHKAYTDWDDVDGDNVIDSTYKDTINYYGYFDPGKCYSYSGAIDTGNFSPTALANGTNSHNCNGVSGGGRWSGNFLNWASMARMDALRKVLYGGYRSTDTTSSTMLERVYIPSDNHAWAKFYSAADLGNFTPYDIGTYPNGITMCNVTPPDASNDPSQTTTTSPRLRIAKGQFPDWAAQESKQCLWYSTTASQNEFTPNSANPTASPNVANGDKVDEFTVRVAACVSGLIGGEKCKTYGTVSKPVGLLQDFADADQLKIRFGLMTGTYGKRKSGGELRKNIARFTDEVNAADGTFTGATGIVQAINVMRISRYSYSDPGYGGTDACPPNQNSWVNGNCSDWGNPMGEIFLEALRYFVAGTSPNSNFTSNDTTWISNLTSPSWVNPYGSASTAPAGGGGSVCAKPNILAVSTGVSSFDNDEYSSASDIPGFGTSALNTQTDAVGNNEGISGNSWYVGSITGGLPTDVCSARTVSNLSTVTGICPEAAGLQGSFKIAGLAYYAHMHSLQTVSGKATPTVDTYAVSLAPPQPSLKIPVGGGRTVTVIPAGYNLRNSNAMQLINFRVISQASDMSTGVYFMNYENASAGSDYDNDIKGYLAYSAPGDGTIRLEMWVTGSSAGATQTMGYTITGVSDPGTYYIVSNTDSFTTNDGTSKFFSTTPAAINTACTAGGFPGTGANESCHFNVADTGGTIESRYMRGIKTHSSGSSSTGLLQQPLWYASKYGGFKDTHRTGVPDATAEWDTNGDGIPDNYFFVTNPSMLEAQLSNAFNAILAHAGSASSASVNSGSISSDTRVFQAKFDTSAWSGDLLAFSIATDGTISSTPNWSAALKMPIPGSRQILTASSTNTMIPFRWASLSAAQQALLYPSDNATMGQNRLNYLRGDRTMEQSQAGGVFRNRDTALGDIVDSAPIYMGKPPFRYPTSLESVAYSSYVTSKASRTPVVYVGANDGMLHAFDASTNSNGTDTTTSGREMFTFIPTAAQPNLYKLTSPNYSHQYFADGTPSVVDAFFGSAWHTVLVSGMNKGGREVYALDVSSPDSIAESTPSGVLLWEFTSAQDSDLGYTFSRPAVVRLHNGVWGAIFGNGYNGTGTGHAALFILNIQTGAVIAKLDTGVGSAGTPNGLATPSAVDIDSDGVVDYVYAGDLLGNLWKFNLTSTTASNWGSSYSDGSGNPAPLFTAKDANNRSQPITVRPVVGFGPGGSGLVVLFGTGKFIEASDRIVDTANPRPQSFYGIFDANTNTASDVVSGRSALEQQSIVFEGPVTVASTDASGAPISLTYKIRAVSSNQVNIATQHGWYIDLVSPTNGYEAEKQVSDPILRNGKVIFTTTIPDADVCAYGGRSWLMEMDAMTGAQLQYSPFDLNNDKKFTDADLVTITVNGQSVTVPVSGLASTNGIMTRPGIVSSTDSEYAISPDTSGDLEEHRQNPGPGAVGRQSWRQLR
jgi:type IV pilus assembly protein PilY1